MDSGRIVVVGASSGGVRALQVLAAQLPADFPAPVLVVQHIGSYESILPQLLTRNGPLAATHAVDRERIASGHIYVAPPDHHMLVEGELIRLSRGAKEQHARPAIDPLFRSAAVSWKERAVGVILTGLLDDGTQGLQAIKRCGGVAVVQDPKDAEMPSMPLSALRHVKVDHQAPLAQLGELLVRLVSAGKPAAATAVPAPGRYVEETETLLGKGNFMELLEAIGMPSTFVCPECDGALWEITNSRPPNFRCHTGHAFSLRSLQHTQAEATDEALWSALRALQEKELLLKSLAELQRESSDREEAERLQREAEQTARHAATLRELIERVPSPSE